MNKLKGECTPLPEDLLDSLSVCLFVYLLACSTSTVKEAQEKQGRKEMKERRGEEARAEEKEKKRKQDD